METHNPAVHRSSSEFTSWFWRCSCGAAVGCFSTEAQAREDAAEHVIWQRRVTTAAAPAVAQASAA